MFKNRKCNLLKGLVIGAGLGLLFAPKKGSETRKDLINKINELSEKIKDIELDDVKETLSIKIDGLKSELADLDKEKVAAITRKKAEDIKNKAEELYKLAVEKGTPVLEKAADEIRKKTAELLKETATKLDNKQKESTPKTTPKK